MVVPDGFFASREEGMLSTTELKYIEALFEEEEYLPEKKKKKKKYD